VAIKLRILKRLVSPPPSPEPPNSKHTIALEEDTSVKEELRVVEAISENSDDEGTTLEELYAEDAPHKYLMGVKVTVIKEKLVVEDYPNQRPPKPKGTNWIFVSECNIRFHATLAWRASPSSMQGQTLLRPATTHLAPTKNSDKGVLIDSQSGFQLIVKSIGSLLTKNANWDEKQALLGCIKRME